MTVDMAIAAATTRSTSSGSAQHRCSIMIPWRVMVIMIAEAAIDYVRLPL